jgi:RimJ/RimL family protein N-acetyltransferase
VPEINEFGQQVNDLVPGWQGAGVLRRTALNGRFCRLEPLDTERHAADLFAAYALGDDSDWTWLASTLPAERGATAHWIAGKVMDDGLVPYAVIDLRAERAVGLVSYMAIERAMGTVEIGHVTWSRDEKYAARDRGGVAAAEKWFATAIVGWSGNAIR